MTKNCKKIQLKIFFIFGQKTIIYLSLGLHKERPSYRRSLQLSKEAIQHFKTWTLKKITVVGDFCPPGSRSGFRIRIRIHWPDWIGIQSGSATLFKSSYEWCRWTSLHFYPLLSDGGYYNNCQLFKDFGILGCLVVATVATEVENKQTCRQLSLDTKLFASLILSKIYPQVFNRAFCIVHSSGAI